MLKLLRSRGGSIRTAVLLLAVLGIFGAAAGILVDKARGPEWKSSVNVLIQSSPGSVVSLVLTGQAAALTTADQVDAATLALSQAVLTQAAAKIGEGRDWTSLASAVTAEPVASSHVISITATATDPTAATEISDAVAASFAEVSKAQLDSATQLVRQLQERSNGALLVCPVDPSAETITIQFADWVRQLNSADSPKSVSPLAEVPVRGGSGDYQQSMSGSESAEWKSALDHSGAGVIVLAAPAESVLEVWPTASEPAAIVLVVPAGTARQALSDAVAILARWRQVDAVVVAQ